MAHNTPARGALAPSTARLEPFPDVPPELLEGLAVRFPDKLPAGPVSEAELARLVGQQSVVRFLRSHLASQMKARGR